MVKAVDPAEALSRYLKEVQNALQRGRATEHTYRPFLVGLFNSLAPGTLTTNEPKRSAAGAPDFVVTTLKFDFSIGYIEAKDLGLSLDDALATEQLARYRRHLPNLLVTDYLEFRWFVGGEKNPRLTARLAHVGSSGKLIPDAGGQAAFLALVREFAARTPEGISAPEPLAERMAALAHLVHDLIVDAFRTGQASPLLRDWHRAFEQTLLPDLTEADFADMFAQTLAYGLFSARIMGGGVKHFDRASAQKHIPKTNPFLRDFFYLITGPGLDDEPFAGFVADIVQTLSLTDVYALLENFGRRGTRDPMLHFYETFLGAYDPKLRELRGVYYTPEPVVGWLVRSVDALLKSHFSLKAGLEDASRDAQGQHRVLVLDPATGTATFLYAVIRFVRGRFQKRNDAGQWPGYVHRDLLPRLFGFELLMAPYAVAHFKLGLELAARDLDELWREQWAYEFHPGERLNIFLTNTLDDAGHKFQQLLGPAGAISAEAQAAAAVKSKLPVLVVMGNPPYSGHSANHGEWISGLVRDYYFVDGKPLGERNSKWLQDDYVKFIRWAQWRLDQTGSGILAFVTNHGYLDNPTFRGMRQQLMQSFDEIWLVDLHGNAKRKETAPDGGDDNNVFDIQQGVALGIFVKLPVESGTKKRPAKVRHAHLWGKRADKYAWLDAHDVTDTKWTPLKPQSPHHLFIPQDLRLKVEFEAGWKITEMMPVNVLGFQTHRDGLAIAATRDALSDRLIELRQAVASDAELAGKYGASDSAHWKLGRAREALRALTLDGAERKIQEVSYRPFDNRWCFFSEELADRPRRELKQHFVGLDNLALNFVRQTKAAAWRHAFASALPTPAVFLEIKDGSSVFPLYLYPNGKRLGELIVEESDGPTPNLAPKFIGEFSAKLELRFIPLGAGDRKKTFGPEDVLHYAYAIFHAPGYRTRYAEFLRRDFPRLPLTANLKLFRQLCGFGKDLVDLHLLRATDKHTVSFPAKGTDTVNEVTYTPPQGSEPGRVRINGEQHFENIPPEVWAFHVGGYQVCERWLKDRRGRQLTIDERATYPRIVGALAETLRLQVEIDAAIATAGGWPLQ
ncbi:MAG: N-6 DNA methylase [Opitutae bacterium]|nr:N-6 DNA methylase [Opitutae bacterium]